MKMMVLRAASRMKSRKGLLALKIFLFIGKERPEMVTAVAAEASLPSSFTCRPREKMGLKYKHYAAWRGLTLLLYRKQGPASLQSTRLLRSERCRFRAIIFPLIFVFYKARGRHIGTKQGSPRGRLCGKPQTRTGLCGPLQ